MRAVFFYSAPEWSGSGRVFAVAARKFAQAGDPVTFVVDSESRSQERVTAGDGLDVQLLETNGWWLAVAMRLRRVLREKNAEVVFVHTEREHLVAGVACWLGRRGAVVRRVPPGFCLKMALGTRFATRVARTAFLFTHDSDVRAAALPERAKTVVAELGVEPPGARAATHTQPGPGEEPAVDMHGSHFLCVYDLHARGRAAMAIRTLALLSGRHPDLHLSIVGPGSDYEDVRMHIAALNLLERVSLLGERDDIPSLITQADLGWIACEGDDAAFAMLDMMGHGVPVVTSEDNIARRYVADGITGLVVPWGDAALAAGMVAGLLSQQEQISSMGEAARARVVRDFTERRMLEGFDRASSLARERTSKG